MFLIKAFSKLPFPVLYALSDGLSFIAYHVIKYRRKVVFDNLKKAFPDKNQKEIAVIAKGFYTNLLDIMVETIKLYTVPEEEIRKRVRIENPELLEDFYLQKRPLLALSSHQCNWEWFAACSLRVEYPIDAVYLKLNNEFSDNLVKKIRGRFGATLVEKRNLLKRLVATKEDVKIISMVADQAPKHDANVLWMPFLNQNTNFFTGFEKIATKFNFPVLYAEMRRTQRGYYMIRFTLLTEKPADLPQNEITRRFVKELEKTIQQSPSNWLWSHKRWKYAYKAEKKQQE